MRVCIIGGTGHIASQLVPMFVRNGIEVTAITRGRSRVPDDDDDASWNSVQVVRAEYLAGDPAWRHNLRDAAADADILIDLLGIDLAGCYEAVTGVCRHVIACGSIWMLGMPRTIPCPARSQGEFWGEAYARRWRVILDVLNRSAVGGPRFTAILPPNICGPGKVPLEPRGGRSVEVHRALMAGQTVFLPAGADALIGPCDVEDVAQAFYLAATQPEASAGQIFNVGAAYALTISEFVASYGEIYGVNLPVQRVDWSEFSRDIVTDPGARYHFQAHMCPDLSETRTRLGYQPRHTPEQSMRRAVEWMKSHNLL